MRQSGHHVSRRSLLGGAAGLAAAGVAGCSSSTSSGPRPSAGGASGAGSAVLPNYVPFGGIKPDLPTTDAGVPGGYLRYPSPIAKVGKVPLKTSFPVRMLVQGPNPGTPIKPNNPWYDMITKDLGVECPMLFASFGDDYVAKLQTTIASNDMPEIMQMVAVPQYPQLLAAKFTDLTPFVGGDKVKDYPGLANIPTSAWKMGMVAGKLYGFVQPRPPVGRAMTTRGDLLEKKGIPRYPKPANGDELFAMFKEVTDPSTGTFAIGAQPVDWLVPVVLEMMGGPNGWKLDGSTMVSSYESPEYEAALEFCKKVWDAKMMYPDSFATPNNNQLWWEAGKTIFFTQGFAAWGTQIALPHPEFKSGAVHIPKWSGGGRSEHHLYAPGYYAPICIPKQTDEKKVVEILRVCDYMAAPFGTEEFMHVVYGVQGRHFDLVDGDPKILDPTKTEKFRGIEYIGSPLNNILYLPGQPEATKELHAFATETMKVTKTNPTFGLYSDANVSKAPTANRTIYQAQSDIIQGRVPLSQWKSIVQTWKSAAGDAMAREFAEAYAANK